MTPFAPCPNILRTPLQLTLQRLGTQGVADKGQILGATLSIFPFVYFTALARKKGSLPQLFPSPVDLGV